MRFIDESRDGAKARALGRAICTIVDPSRSYRLMEFCGGHTHAVHRYGITQLLPRNVELLHGPGCPVCVLPSSKVAEAFALSLDKDVILCCYGDLPRVPTATGDTLLKAKARGGNVRMVYSSLDAVQIAQENPQKRLVFFAIGFETTTPPTAVALQEALRLNLTNFFVHCNHVLTPPAIMALFSNGTRVDGVIGPAHVSTVIGSNAYIGFAETFRTPVVIAGFEPLDVLESIYMLIEDLNHNRHSVRNEYIRSVLPDGNEKAQEIVHQFFQMRKSFVWRGLGAIPSSALELRSLYSAFDAEKIFAELLSSVAEQPEPPGCACGEILRGLKNPTDCPFFGAACSPDNPIGACMVSSEGACAAWYSYSRHNIRTRQQSL